MRRKEKGLIESEKADSGPGRQWRKLKVCDVR